jgi:hypothetical protein
LFFLTFLFQRFCAPLGVPLPWLCVSCVDLCSLAVISQVLRFICFYKVITNVYNDYIYNFQSRGSVVRYSDWLRVGRLRGRSLSPDRVKNFLLSKLSRPALGSTQPPIQWVPGALSGGDGVKRPGREADHTPPSSTEVKKMWIYISTPPYAFMV